MLSVLTVCLIPFLSPQQTQRALHILTTMNGNNAVQPMAAGLENGESTEKELQAKALAQIANVSKLFRDAIGASLPGKSSTDNMLRTCTKI